MSRIALIALMSAFLLAGLAVALVGGAQAGGATSSQMGSQPGNASSHAAPIERCALQPQRVTHPTSGAPILILLSDC